MSRRCLPVGFVGVLVASCAGNPPVAAPCEGCVEVDGVPAITTMTLDREGRIVAAANGPTSMGRVRALARMDRFGVLDRSFGERGLAASPDSLDPTAIVVQDTGAIRVGGAAHAEFQPVVFGFTADGHDDGLRITGSGAFQQPVQYLMDQGGALVASHAYSTGYEGLLVRYAANGVRDTSFEPTPVERAVAITAQGAFVTAGRSLDEDPRRFLARRVTRDGQIDASFGGGAVVVPDVDRGTGEIRVAARSDGGLVMVGTQGDDAPKVFVARFDGAGNPDASFGGRGYVTHDLGEATILAIAELADGTVMLAGVVQTPGLRPYRALIVRLAPDGSLDTRFGDGGRFLLERDKSFFAGLVVLPDGEVIAGGSSGTTSLLATFPPL